MTVALRFGLPSGGDAELAALVMTCAAAGVAAVAAVVEPGAHTVGDADDLALFAFAGLIAPGASQVFFTRAVRDAGPSRASVVVGSAPPRRRSARRERRHPHRRLSLICRVPQTCPHGSPTGVETVEE
jgi:hypothetical protein